MSVGTSALLLLFWSIIYGYKKAWEHKNFSREALKVIKANPSSGLTTGLTTLEWYILILTKLSSKVVSLVLSTPTIEKYIPLGTALGIHATSLLTDLPLSQTQTRMRQKRIRRKEAQETPTTTPLVEERC